MIDNLYIAVYVFGRRILISLSVLLPRYVNLSTNFRGLSLKVEMASSRFKE